MQARYFFQLFLIKQVGIWQQNVAASIPTISQVSISIFLVLWLVGSNAVAVDCAPTIGSPNKPSAFQRYQRHEPTAPLFMSEYSHDDSFASSDNNQISESEVAPEQPLDLARPFQCNYANCLKKFKTIYALKDHIRVHTKERPFVCAYDGCMKRFADRSNLNKHKEIHAGIKRYYCSYPNCGRGFLLKSDFVRHATVHSTMKNFPCRLCLKYFKRKDNLKRHLRQVHGEEFWCEDG